MHLELLLEFLLLLGTLERLVDIGKLVIEDVALDDVGRFQLGKVGRDLSGKAAQLVLERGGITANKNMVPFDPRKPMVTSGIRIGTPAITTRGMGEAEMAQIGDYIARVLDNAKDESIIAEVRRDVEALCARFPLYAGRGCGAG